MNAHGSRVQTGSQSRPYKETVRRWISHTRTRFTSTKFVDRPFRSNASSSTTTVGTPTTTMFTLRELISLLVLITLAIHLLASVVDALPLERPEQAAQRQKLYMRMMGISDPAPAPAPVAAGAVQSDSPPSNNNNNDIPPATPFPSIKLAPHLSQHQKQQQQEEKPIDQPDNFDEPLTGRQSHQFGSDDAPRDPFANPNAIGGGQQRSARSSGVQFPWPTPPPVPRRAVAAGARRSQPGAERDLPLPEQIDDSAIVPSRRRAPKAKAIAPARSPARSFISPAAEETLQQAPLVLDPRNKPGSCPSLLGGARVCYDRCKDDSECDGPSKCCWNGCGRTCAAPER